MEIDKQRKLKVFLCHANEDKPAVRILYHDLVNDGIDEWLDEEKLLPGHDWNLEIAKAEREADAIVICLSQKSVSKEGYVQKEIKRALGFSEEKPEGRIYIIPARMESCDVPNSLQHLQWVDLFTPKGYPSLRNALRARGKELSLISNPQETKVTKNGADKPSERNKIKEIQLEMQKTPLNSTVAEAEVSPVRRLFPQLVVFISFIFLIAIDVYFTSNALYITR